MRAPWFKIYTLIEKISYIISKEANQLNVSVEPVIGHVGFQLWPYEKGKGGLSCYFDNVVVTPDQ